MRHHFSQYHRESFQKQRLAKLAKILESLPSRRLCDVLLRAFLLSVSPIIPLVLVSDFKERYKVFWKHRSKRGNAAEDEEYVYEADPSFVCLLWAVLYAGAVAASPAMLAEASFRIANRPAFLARMRDKTDAAIEAYCGRNMQFPALSGLVASLIAHQCDPTIDPLVDEAPFIARSFQGARALGLSHEAVLAAMPPADAEIGRRVWYNLLDMEVMSTIRCGASPSGHGCERGFDTRAPRGEEDTASFVLTVAQRRMTSVVRCIIQTRGAGDDNDDDTSGPEAVAQLADEIEQFDSFIDELVVCLLRR